MSAIRATCEVYLREQREDRELFRQRLAAEGILDAWERGEAIKYEVESARLRRLSEQIEAIAARHDGRGDSAR